MRVRFLTLLGLFCALPVLAQSDAPVVHSIPDLEARSMKLVQAAKESPGGLAVETLDDYGKDSTLMVVRVKTGAAERHKLFVDQIVILKGTMTLVTGGTMLAETARTGPKTEGESVGTGIAGGRVVRVHSGEIVHIAAGVPHWVKVDPGAPLIYLIFKER